MVKSPNLLVLQMHVILLVRQGLLRPFTTSWFTSGVKLFGSVHPSITLGSPYLPWIKLGEATHLLYQGLIERDLTSFGGMKPVDEVMSYIDFCE